MKDSVRGRAPFWRAPEARVVRPELWAMAIVVVGMLLVEVWQTARMTETCLVLDHDRRVLTQERSRMEYNRARGDRRWNRPELEPIARRSGLAPIQGSQQIELPAGYLARASVTRSEPGSPVLAWLDRLSTALVPEATARSR